MKVAAPPYMPLYVGDFLGSTALWTGIERGIFLQLLALQWSSGPLPRDPKKLAQVTSHDIDAFRLAWKTVAEKFEPSPNGLINKRLEQHRARSLELQAVRSEVGKARADRRWKKDGKSNGKGNAESIPEAMLNA